MKKKRIKVGTNRKLEKKYNKFLTKELKMILEGMESETDLQKLYDNIKDRIDTIKRKDVDTLLNILLELMIAELDKNFNIQDGELSEQDKIIMSQFVENNTNLIASLFDDTKKKIGHIITNAIIEGDTIQDITKELIKASDMSYNRAKLIAITETSRTNSQLARERFKKQGVTKVVWSSAHDKRTRPCHRARDGVTFELEKGCFSGCDGRYLQTGQEVRCRCAMIGILY
jgi:SPP1 gp7 family putative phage head morphogenesis protein